MQNSSPDDDVNVGLEEDVLTNAMIPQPLKELVKLNKGKLPGFFSKNEVDATRCKKDDPMWFEQRTARITGSNAHNVLVKARKNNKGVNVNMENLFSDIMGQTSLDANLPPLKYGQEMEPLALKEIFKHYV